jgi:hypothetical protein
MTVSGIGCWSGWNECNRRLMPFVTRSHLDIQTQQLYLISHFTFNLHNSDWICVNRIRISSSPLGPEVMNWSLEFELLCCDVCCWMYAIWIKQMLETDVGTSELNPPVYFETPFILPKVNAFFVSLNILRFRQYKRMTIFSSDWVPLDVTITWNSSINRIPKYMTISFLKRWVSGEDPCRTSEQTPVHLKLRNRHRVDRRSLQDLDRDPLCNPTSRMPLKKLTTRVLLDLNMEDMIWYNI